MNKIISRQAAAELVNDHDTVVVCGCENLLLPDRILSALEERYMSTGHPCGLTDIPFSITIIRTISFSRVSARRCSGRAILNP